MLQTHAEIPPFPPVDLREWGHSGACCCGVKPWKTVGSETDPRVTDPTTLAPEDTFVPLLASHLHEVLSPSFHQTEVVARSWGVARSAQ